MVESPLKIVSGIATPLSFNGILPCNAACTIDDALFELLRRGLEVGTRIRVVLSACDESAEAGVWVAVWADIRT